MVTENRYPFTAAGLTAALAALGGTANEVADTLATLGVRGAAGCDATCPVANYLYDLYGTVSIPAVVDEHAVLAAELWPLDPDVARIAVLVPAPVAEFVRAFDAGAYPDLAYGDREEVAA